MIDLTGLFRLPILWALLNNHLDLVVIGSRLCKFLVGCNTVAMGDE